MHSRNTPPSPNPRAFFSSTDNRWIKFAGTGLIGSILLIMIGEGAHVPGLMGTGYGMGSVSAVMLIMLWFNQAPARAGRRWYGKIAVPERWNKEEIKTAEDGVIIAALCSSPYGKKVLVMPIEGKKLQLRSGGLFRGRPALLDENQKPVMPCPLHGAETLAAAYEAEPVLWLPQTFRIWGGIQKPRELILTVVFGGPGRLKKLLVD